MASSGAGAVSRVSGVLLSFRAVFVSTAFLQFVVVVDVCTWYSWFGGVCGYLQKSILKESREKVRGLPRALENVALGH